MKEKVVKKPVLTPEKVYDNLTILLLSISCFFFAGIILTNQNLTIPNLKIYLGLGLFSLSFILFMYLIADIFAYYSLKTYSWVRNNWEIYKWYYWISVLIIALGILIWIGYYKLTTDTFWSVIIAMFGAAILTAIGWIIFNRIGKKSH